MKLHIVSDIHLEFGKLKYTPPECDVVIVAGDTRPGVAGLIWAAETYGSAMGMPVIYIAGNHEYWGKRRLHRHTEKMRKKAEDLGILFLQNDEVIIDGVRILGCTLWTDLNLNGDQPLALVRAMTDMNDYQQIRFDIQQKLYPYHTVAEHEKSMEFLTDALNTTFNGKTVVITHHSPSELSCISKYHGDPSNYLYASRLEKFIEVMDPVLWVHGHVHQSNDYLIGNTRIVCNPRGYNDYEPNPEFDLQLVVEI